MTNSISGYDFSRCKSCGEEGVESKYRLRSGHSIYVCPECGLHYIDYLDDPDALDLDLETPTLTPEQGEHIRGTLQYNRERFEGQVAAVASVIDLRGARVFDIGAGGGLFLALMRERGAQVGGVELHPQRRAFARERYGIELEALPFDAEHPRADQEGTYDVVSLWDVIEHVNFPLQTMQLAARLLKPGGVLAIDTPARDSAFHKTGELSSRLSGGRYATFLDVLYAATPFAHKQILSLDDLRRYAEQSGLVVERCTQFRELSFPASAYLQRHLPSKHLTQVLSTVLEQPVKRFGPRNKALLLARRPSA